jgi:hypothetical protein
MLYKECIDRQDGDFSSLVPATLDDLKAALVEHGYAAVSIGHLQCVQNQLSSAKDAIEGAEGWVDDFVAEHETAQEQDDERIGKFETFDASTLPQTCEHDKGFSDYCEPCGRIHNGGGRG